MRTFDPSTGFLNLETVLEFLAGMNINEESCERFGIDFKEIRVSQSRIFKRIVNDIED